MNVIFQTAVLFVLLLGAMTLRLNAQQNANTTNSFAEIKDKAESGDVEAQSRLAFYFDNGVGVTKDSVEAVKWYRKAAEQGFGYAQFNLAISYEKGEGVTQDFAEAAKWYRKSAADGSPLAEYCLGSCYASGKGVATNYIEAINWYRKAAIQGLDKAQVSLGSFYESGDGVSKDFTEAAKWYRKAANQGNEDGQLLLGSIYFFGKGVSVDFIEAYKWFNLASAHGVETAKNGLSILEKKMTPDQIGEAQRLAREFKAHKTLGPDSANSEPSTTGTGFFITDDGYFISNNHVVKDATKVRIVTSAGTVEAKVVQMDAANDLALLKAEGRFAPLPILPSRKVSLGNTVATVGFPDPGLQGFSPKLAKGEIASLSGAADDARYFQISVPVQPGNSGGALVDEHGNVVGIVSAKLNAAAALQSSGALPENVNYAVKSSFLLGFLESVPAVASKLKEPSIKEQKFEDVVKEMQAAAVLVLVY